LIEAAKIQNLQTEECSDSSEDEERKRSSRSNWHVGENLKQASWLAAEQFQGPFVGTNHKKVVLFNRWNLL
jgi:hypothetical protein